MTTLLVDAGNARLKWARLENIGADGLHISDVRAVELHADVESALSEFSAALAADIDAVVVGNVAGPAIGERIAGVLQRFSVAIVWFARSHSVSCGVRNAYPQPHTLGVDRWAAIVAAFRRAHASASSRPVCVVDAGTALTIDAISADGSHLGGLILPGLRMQHEALLGGTADIRMPLSDSVSLAHGLDVFASSTAEALAHSGRFACAAVLDRCVRLLGEVYGPASVLLTGGDAAELAPWLESDAEICPNLVFEGLALLFEDRKSD